MLQILCWR